MADGSVTFYSSVRTGAALAIQRNEFSTALPAEPRARINVNLDYGSGHAATTTLPLVGPGDIVGLDTRAIVRTFPRPDDNDAEAGFLCYAELDQIDLPWRYTPAGASGVVGSGTDQLRPWLSVLVLVEGTELADADLRAPQGAEKLPQLTVRDASLLPDLSEAWAWAHVQGGESLDDGGLAAALAAHPGALVARLLAPRKLAPQTAYRAFVVPTFQRGVLAGQGIAPKDMENVDALAPAWPSPAPAPVTLPVYHSWRFQTGSVSSFSEAVRQLRPVATLPETVGLRAMDVTAPGFNLPSLTGGTDPLLVGGALQTSVQAGLGDSTLSDDWVQKLGTFVDLGVQTVNGQQLRVVTPPLYGRWYAAEDHLDVPGQIAPATNPPWFAALNRDPRFRVAAGLGTEVVAREQQALLAAALEQAARLERVNRARRVFQIGREVFARMMGRHLSTGSGASIFLVTSYLHGKLLSCAGAAPRPTIDGVLRGTFFGRRPHGWRRRFRGDVTGLINTINGGGFTPLPATPPGMSTPDGTIGPDIPGGLPDPGVGTIIATMNADQRLFWGVVTFWVARRLLSTEAGKYWWLLRRLLRLGLDLIALAGTQGIAGVTLLQKLRAGTLTSADIQAIPQASNFSPLISDPTLADARTWPGARGPATGGDDLSAQAFRQAVATLFDFVSAAPPAVPSIGPADVPGLVACILAGLAPAVTLVAAEKSRHRLSQTIAWQAADELEPILLPPAIGVPMWQSLRDVSTDWILPGVGDVPRNSVALLETNQRFIESFMVGLNHQMTRELLWTGYPTDQRGTYFQQFWDFRGWAKGSATDADRGDDAFADITAVAAWDRASTLGSHTARQPAFEHLVLLVRGDVIKRYPNLVVYAAQTLDPASDQQHPVFQGFLTADIAFYGFELTVPQARGTDGGAGWYFVLQEHPSEPKFVRADSADVNNVHPGDYVIGLSASAAVANGAYETPLRVAIHGSDLLPAPSA